MKVILNRFEKLYIAKYDSVKNGYNVEYGGSSCLRKGKAVIMYDLDGEVIKIFDSVKSAIRATGCGAMNAILQNKQKTYKQKYTFKYEDEPFTPISYKHHHRPKVFISPKSVSCYKDGLLIKTFNTISEAAKYYNVSSVAIGKAVDKPNRTSIGFNWISE